MNDDTKHDDTSLSARQERNQKRMGVGRTMGIVFLVLGIPMTVFAINSANSVGFTLKILTAGPALAIFGLTLLIFPGGKVNLYQLINNEKDFVRDVLLGAPLVHKISYGVALVLALVVHVQIWGA